MEKSNFMEVKFKSLSINEGFARICVAGFCMQLNPSVEELDDIKTSVSEAVTNCVVHAYPNMTGIITLSCEISGDNVKIVVKDNGVGISDISKAREPFFTTKPDDEERSGMGFTVMENFMDSVDVQENNGGGTIVTMSKQIKNSMLKVKDA